VFFGKMMLCMENNDSLGIFRPIVAPWYESLRDPSEAQRTLLPELLKGYSRTHYGASYHASEIKEIEDFKKRFPIVDYKGLQPHLKKVENGDFEALLPEPLACWVMTRGSTGPAKVLPATRTHLEQIFTCGARALINHVLRTKDSELLTGRIFNLNFPSNVHTITVEGKTMSYGYSSGTYARLNPALESVSLLPRQEEIDTLGSGIARNDWEKRFELAYQQSLGMNVTAAMGVTPVIMSFARYVNRKHGKRPKDIWNLRALFCTSVRKIQFKYGLALRKYFGEIPVVEIYSATEGVFAQQIDDLPYVTPNYDAYLLEVETGKGAKMLHELRRGEWGRLIVSSCMLPRYRMGDLIESAGKNYFRVFGRDKVTTLLEHRLYRMIFGRLT
jgi:phenylacetate-coenzyme A ligase PaaK-like adenylate-forming protein